MSQVFSSRRGRWLVVGALAAMLTVATVAVGIATTGSPDTIVLTLNGSTRQFEHNGETQDLRLGTSECNVTALSLSGPIMEVSASTFTKKGKPVVPAAVGIVDNGIGVNEKGVGNGQDCGLTDRLDAEHTEKLVLRLGDALAGRLIDHVQFDFEAKFNAEVKVEYRLGGEQGELRKTETWPLTLEGSDSGPDAGSKDNYQITSTSGLDADTVVISMNVGSVSLEGGADWSDGWTTVFHLKEGTPQIDISVKPDGPFDAATGSSINWAYTVTNPGDYALSNVKVIDDFGTLSTPDSGDANADGRLDRNETWRYTRTETALAGSQTHTATASGQAPNADLVSDSEATDYSGFTLGLSLTLSNSGDDVVGFDTPLIDVSTDVENPTVIWTYQITNTGNVDLSGLTLNDDVGGASTDCPSILAAGDSATCTKSLTAVRDLVTNTASVSATRAGGTETVASSEATSSYFGSFPSFLVELTLNGNPIAPVPDDPSPDDETAAPVVVSPITWGVTVTNDGNVPLTFVDASQIGFPENDCDPPIGTLEVGASKTCTITEEFEPTVQEDGTETTSFQVEGRDPLDGIYDVVTGGYEFYPSYGCQTPTLVEGGPLRDDDPIAGFFVGPLKFEGTCAVPVVITTASTLDDPEVDEIDEEQTVFVGPPDGYESSWLGVTGLLTVVWDVENPAPVSVRPTFQELSPGVVETVPDCGGDVAVQYNEPETGFAYTLVDNDDDDFGTYPLATGGGNICLVFHLTETINYTPTDPITGSATGPQAVKTLTTEVFYIYNDPILSRPR